MSFLGRIFRGKDRPGGRKRRREEDAQDAADGPLVESVNDYEEPLTADEMALRAAEKEVASEWFVGDTILGLYEVKEVNTEGGMGLLYRVHHRGWDLDLAVKSPRPRAFRSDAQKQTFVRECETWIDLGMHPHIVSCHYVRMLGGVPRVFAEYAEGGSLSDLIRTGALYEGDRDEILPRMLDIAIQCAWGLAHAQETGVVHMDVKPSNVMLTRDGTVKVTDFGISRAHAAAHALDPDAAVSSRAMSPAYCSPEQAGHGAVSGKTDIWSFGLTVLEMFTAGLTWLAGQAAPEVLEQFLETGPDSEDVPAMPEGLAELLRSCFRVNPDERPASFEEIASTLRKIYVEAAGRGYPRSVPWSAGMLSDGLNNRAVSFLDMGRTDAAEEALTRALSADPHHIEASYNRGILLWRAGRWSDDALLREFDQVRASHEEEWRVHYLLGLLHTERGDANAALESLEEADGLAPTSEEVRKALAWARREVGHGESSIDARRGSLTSLCFTPDGTEIMAAARGAVDLWDLDGRERASSLQGVADGVLAAAVSPNQLWIVSAGADGLVRLWHTNTGKHWRDMEGHRDEVTSLGISRDSRFALTGSRDETVRLWDLSAGACVRSLTGHRDQVEGVAIGPNGRWAASGSADRTVRVWDLNDGNELAVLRGHEDGVTAVGLSPKGGMILSASHDETLRVWGAQTGRVIRTLEGHTGSVTSLAMSEDGAWVVSGSYDGTVRVWELASGRCVRTFEGHRGWVHSVAIDRARSRVASGGDDGFIRIWDVEGIGRRTSRPAVAFPASGTELKEQAARVRAALRRARVAFKAGRAEEALAELREGRNVPGYERSANLIKLWKQAGREGRRDGLRGAWCARPRIAHAGRIGCVAVSPDGSRVLSGGQDRLLRVWDPTLRNNPVTLEGHVDEVLCAGFLPGGNCAVSAGADSMVRVWDIEEESCELVLPGHTEWINGLSVSADGRLLLTASSDETIRLWDLASGRCLTVLTGHTSKVLAVSFLPGEERCVSASHDDTLCLWDLASGTALRTFRGHENWVNDVASSPDGRRFLSGGWDSTVRLWDPEADEPVQTMIGHRGRVNAVRFTPDGRWALSAGQDATVRLWDLRGGTCAHTVRGHRDEVEALAVGPDGMWAVSSSEDHSLRRWELDWDYEIRGAGTPLEELDGVLDAFLATHRRREEGVVTRSGPPAWDDADLEQLFDGLRAAGHGSIDRPALREELARRAVEWQGPPGADV